MASGAAIFNEQQTYGNGLVNMQGTLTFSNGTGTFAVSHGKGFTCTRTITGVYKVVLTPSFKGIHAVDGNMTLPASQGASAPSHPGFVQAGDLQSDAQSFYLYTYNSSASSADPASGNLVNFNVVVSMSSLNP